MSKYSYKKLIMKVLLKKIMQLYMNMYNKYTGPKFASYILYYKMKHSWIYIADQSFLPIVFKSQGLVGKNFLQHFDKLWTKSEPPPITPLKIYWYRRLSLTLQRSVAQAINISMTSLHAGPACPTAGDESAGIDRKFSVGMLSKRETQQRLFFSDLALLYDVL